jgi:hypothetical protein
MGVKRETAGWPDRGTFTDSGLPCIFFNRIGTCRQRVIVGKTQEAEVEEFKPWKNPRLEHGGRIARDWMAASPANRLEKC